MLRISILLFLANRGFSPPIFVFFGRKLSENNKNFPTGYFFLRGGIAQVPPCDDATGAITVGATFPLSSGLFYFLSSTSSLFCFPSLPLPSPLLPSIICFFFSSFLPDADMQIPVHFNSADYIRPSGFLCCRLDGLELTADRISLSV